jgi:hypothetical protein
MTHGKGGALLSGVVTTSYEVASRVQWVPCVYWGYVRGGGGGGGLRPVMRSIFDWGSKCRPCCEVGSPTSTLVVRLIQPPRVSFVCTLALGCKARRKAILSLPWRGRLGWSCVARSLSANGDEMPLVLGVGAWFAHSLSNERHARCHSRGVV